MATSALDLILRTKREGDAPQKALDDLQDMKTGLTDVEKAMAGTRSTVGNLDRDISVFGTNVGSTADLLSGLGVSIPTSPMQLFGSAIKEAGGYIKDSIGEYSSYVEQVSKMAAFTGMTTEETSRLVQVADDLRIETDTVKMAMKAMAQQGTEPSIEGLAQLSDQYLAIQDPLARAQFLTDNFGRSGQEMARLMLMGSDAIKDATGAVEEWMVVTGKSQEQVDEYMRTQDEWNENIQEFKFQIATQALPVLNDFMQSVMRTNEQVDQGNAGWLRIIPTLWGAYNAYLAVKNVINEIVSAPSVSVPKVTRGGGRASGGPVSAGVAYPVGEREREYFVAPSNGSIVPESQLGGVNITLVYNPTVSLASRSEAETVLAPYILSALRKAKA